MFLYLVVLVGVLEPGHGVVVHGMWCATYPSVVLCCYGVVKLGNRMLLVCSAPGI